MNAGNFRYIPQQRQNEEHGEREEDCEWNIRDAEPAIDDPPCGRGKQRVRDGCCTQTKLRLSAARRKPQETPGSTALREAARPAPAFKPIAVPSAVIQYRSGGFSNQGEPQSLGVMKSPLRAIA